MYSFPYTFISGNLKELGLELKAEVLQVRLLIQLQPGSNYFYSLQRLGREQVLEQVQHNQFQPSPVINKFIVYYLLKEISKIKITE